MNMLFKDKKKLQNDSNDQLEWQKIPAASYCGKMLEEYAIANKLLERS